MVALRHTCLDRFPFSHQIVSWMCVNVMVCCVWVEVDKTLCKAGIIVIISSSYLDSFLIRGKILFSYGGLAYYPACMYSLMPLSLLTDQPLFKKFFNLAISLEYQ